MADLPRLTAIALELAKDQKVQAVLQADGRGNELFAACAAFAGRSGWTHAYSVVFQPGQSVSEHTHDEDVVLFYPNGAESPVIVEGEAIYPKVGEMLFMAKHVKHEVPPNTADTARISIAVKVTDQ